MGVTCITQEHSSAIAPCRLFKALIVDSHNLLPKLLPDNIKSIEFIQGDGGAGSIKVTHLSESSHFKTLKHKITELDTVNFVYKYSLIDCDVISSKIESVDYEVKYEESSNGGSLIKVTSKYNTKADVVLNEEEIKGGKEKAMAMYSVVETYLLENPTAYA